MNKKGFVLAEAIIVAVFVLGIFSYLSINILPLISKYDKALDYDNIGEIYLINDFYDEIVFRNMLVSEGNYKYSNTASGIECKKDGNDYNFSICDDEFKIIIYDYFKINEVLVLVPDYTLSNESRSMREYYNYYKNKNGIDQKVMLVKFQNGKFASIKMED